MSFHFMNPVRVMQLVELIRGITTDEATYRTPYEVVEKLGKSAASAEDFPASIGRRILMPVTNGAVYEGVARCSRSTSRSSSASTIRWGPLELADPHRPLHLPGINVLRDGQADTKYRACSLLTKYVEAGEARAQDRPRLLRLSRRDARAHGVTPPPEPSRSRSDRHAQQAAAEGQGRA